MKPEDRSDPSVVPVTHSDAAPADGDGGYWSPSAAAAPLPPGAARRADAADFGIEEPKTYEFPARARSPLPHAVAFVILLILTGVVAMTVGFTWEGEDIGSGAYSTVVALALATVGSGLLWIRRIGVNARLFGLPLTALALLPWANVALPLMSTEGTAVVGIAFRLVAAILATFAFGLFVRRTFVTKVWTAGRIPHDSLSGLLWLPELVATEVLLIGSFVNVLRHEERTFTTQSGITITTIEIEQLSPTLVVFCLLIIVLSAVAMITTLVIATVLQHMGITREKGERAQEQAEKDADLALQHPATR